MIYFPLYLYIYIYDQFFYNLGGLAISLFVLEICILLVGFILDLYLPITIRCLFIFGVIYMSNIYMVIIQIQRSYHATCLAKYWDFCQLVFLKNIEEDGDVKESYISTSWSPSTKKKGGYEVILWALAAHLLEPRCWRR